MDRTSAACLAFNQNNAQKGKINEEVAERVAAAALLDLGDVKNPEAEEKTEHGEIQKTHTHPRSFPCLPLG